MTITADPGTIVPWNVGRAEGEEAILRRLRELRGGKAMFDSWTFFDHLVVTLCVIDAGVLRTLRVDFDGTSLTAGNDLGNQITEAKLDSKEPDHVRMDGPRVPERAGRPRLRLVSPGGEPTNRRARVERN